MISGYSSPHPSHNISLSFDRVELGDQGKPRWRHGGAVVQLQITARILSERSLVFQLTDLLFSRSFKCDKKKVLYFEQEGSSLCIYPGLSDKVLILHCLKSFDHSSTGKI